MMDLLEGLETTDLDGGPAFRVIGLRGESGGEVAWF
jgi:hypothetical protein